jgi:hypothetical protein
LVKGSRGMKMEDVILKLRVMLKYSGWEISSFYKF